MALRVRVEAGDPALVLDRFLAENAAEHLDSEAQFRVGRGDVTSDTALRISSFFWVGRFW